MIIHGMGATDLTAANCFTDAEIADFEARFGPDAAADARARACSNVAKAPADTKSAAMWLFIALGVVLVGGALTPRP